MTRAQSVVQRALPFGAPHHAVYAVGFAVVLSQADEEITQVRMQWAKRARLTATQIHFAQIFDAGYVIAEYIFVPAINFDATLVSLRQDFGDDVEVAVLGSARLLERCIAIEFRMRRGVVAAMKIEVVFLLAMVGQRTIPDLAPGDASAISECRQENGVYGAFFLQDIEDFFRAFIDERNSTHLDADHLL